MFKLEKKANWVRVQILEMIASAGKGHIGGALSCTDILVSLYYGGILRFNANNPRMKDRDRFILSKGHSAAALYVILADLGFFPFRQIRDYQKEKCLLGGHPDRRIPGIEADTGSLGHGLGIGAGLALGAKMNQQDFFTFVLLGDGECSEGSVWEAAMFAAKHQLNNLIGIIDRNRLCSTDFIDECVCLDPLEDKWKAFGWNVSIVNGHSFKDLTSAFSRARKQKSSRPLMLIADTIKGKGIKFMENDPAWHHGVPKGQQLEMARKELGICRK